MSEEEKKAIEYYQDKDVSFTLENFDVDEFKKTLGITEEDSFENHSIRIKTLLNLIEKKDKMIDLMAEFIKKRNSSDVIDYCNTENCTYEKTYCDTSCIKEYFRKKVENE